MRRHRDVVARRRQPASRRGAHALGGSGVATTRADFVRRAYDGFARIDRRGEGPSAFAASPRDARGAVVAPGGQRVLPERLEVKYLPSLARDFFPRRLARRRRRRRETVPRRALGPRARRAGDRRAVRRQVWRRRRVLAPGVGVEISADRRALAGRALGGGEPGRNRASGGLPRERLQARVRRDSRRVRVVGRGKLRVRVRASDPLGGRTQLPRVFRDLRHRRRRRVRARRVLEEKRNRGQRSASERARRFRDFRVGDGRRRSSPRGGKRKRAPAPHAVDAGEVGVRRDHDQRDDGSGVRRKPRVQRDAGAPLRRVHGDAGGVRLLARVHVRAESAGAPGEAARKKRKRPRLDERRRRLRGIGFAVDVASAARRRAGVAESFVAAGVAVGAAVVPGSSPFRDAPRSFRGGIFHGRARASSRA